MHHLLIEGYRLDMQRRGLTPRSVYCLTGKIRGFSNWLAIPLADASTEDVEIFLDGRRNGERKVTARTRYGWVSALHGFYSWAVLHGMADHDPTAPIIRPKLRRTLPRPVSDDDFKLAVKNADPMMRSWITLAGFAGLRCAEIGGLHHDDIRTDLGMLRVLGKGERERMVPIHPRVLAALPPPRRTGLVFIRPMGGAWPPSLVSRTGNLYLDSIGVNATMHQFRHWFGTKTYAACKDIRVVQELMGHSSCTTTAIYTAFSSSESISAVTALDLPDDD